MSWFCKAGLSAVVVACVLVLAPLTAFARYPDDNGHHYGQLWNPGHHYGQLKHQPAPPTPPANPTPTTHPGSSGTADSPTQTAGAGTGQSSGSESSIPDLPITLPLPGEEPQVQLVGSSPGGDSLGWLLLVILPALAAVWLMVFARAAQSARRRRKAAV